MSSIVSRAPTILIQYVPHAFGWKAMNLPFVAWVLIRRVRQRDDVRVMFHEVAFPWVRRPMRHNVIAVVNRVMAAMLVRACTRAYVTIPGWAPHLRRLGAGRLPIAWTPVPSSVPEEASTSAVAARRAELTCVIRPPSAALPLRHLRPVGRRDPGPCRARAARPSARGRRCFSLGPAGTNGGGNWPASGRTGTPASSPRCAARPLIAEYLRACDLVIQPYPDGASDRRTT